MLLLLSGRFSLLCKEPELIMNNISILKGDITSLEIDVIVNAANSSLLGGSGVDGAIHKKGGPSILQECQKIRNKQGGCKVGQAVITNSGYLPCKFVIHTVGPVWKNGKENEKELLYSSYLNSLKLAEDIRAKTIAFPNISTGTYRFPKLEAAQIAVKTIMHFLDNCESLEKVIFMCFDEENYHIYQNILRIEKQNP